MTTLQPDNIKLTTGLPSIDRVLGELKPGEVTSIQSPEFSHISVDTALSFEIIKNLCEMGNRVVCFDNRSTLQTLLCYIAITREIGTPGDVASNYFSAQDFRDLLKAREKIRGWKLCYEAIDDGNSDFAGTLEDVDDMINDFEEQVDVVIVNEFSDGRGIYSPTLDDEECFLRLKYLATKFNFHLVVISRFDFSGLKFIENFKKMSDNTIRLFVSKMAAVETGSKKALLYNIDALVQKKGCEEFEAKLELRSDVGLLDTSVVSTKMS